MCPVNIFSHVSINCTKDFDCRRVSFVRVRDCVCFIMIAWISKVFESVPVPVWQAGRALGHAAPAPYAPLCERARASNTQKRVYSSTHTHISAASGCISLGKISYDYDWSMYKNVLDNPICAMACC